MLNHQPVSSTQDSNIQKRHLIILIRTTITIIMMKRKSPILHHNKRIVKGDPMLLHKYTLIKVSTDIKPKIIKEKIMNHFTAKRKRITNVSTILTKLISQNNMRTK